MATFRTQLAGTAASLALTALAAQAHADGLKTVFVIAMENHNWIQPTQKFGGQTQQIKGNPAAPFINSLVDGTAWATINGTSVDISSQVAYTDTYHNVLATPSGNNPHIHPSEPNYVWAEAGSNFGIKNDNDPYGPGGTNLNVPMHLTTLLTNAGYSWKSYQEDTDVNLQTNQPLSPSKWTVPLSSFAGNFTKGGTNAYNGSRQYHYAAKHNPQVFFTNTNGGDNATPSNLLARNYAPLQQLAMDLQTGNTANYNWITPNEFNDMHTALAGGFKRPGTDATVYGDRSNIAQGDYFLSQVVPLIMSSPVYQHGGAIVIWWDESEGADDFAHSVGEIVISPLAHPNVNNKPYDSVKYNYSHSSDLLTWQEVFGVGPCLRDACNSSDLSDLFAPGVIPSGISGF